jgi:hypothetical protein
MITLNNDARMRQPFHNRWLNKNVFAFGLTRFLSDFCHEMATVVLPWFVIAYGDIKFLKPI